MGATITGPASAANLDALSDVDTTGADSGEVLLFGIDGIWRPGPPPGSHPDLLAHSAMGLATTVEVGELVLAHAEATAGVHGIADTGALVVTTDPRLSDARTPLAHSHAYDPSGTAAGLVSAHSGATTNVHGIADTAQLLGLDRLGLDPVYLIENGNVNLNAPGFFHDGVTLPDGQRVLLQGQTDNTQNGVYVRSGSTLVRAPGYEAGTVWPVGRLFTPLRGTLAGRIFRSTAAVTAVIGTNAITFTTFGAHPLASSIDNSHVASWANIGHEKLGQINGLALMGSNAAGWNNIMHLTTAQVKTMLGYQLESEKNQSNGYAGLNASGRLQYTLVDRVSTLRDINGNEWLRQTAVASAANDVTIVNAVAGDSPVISASGDDTNLDLVLQGKGSGKIKFNSNRVQIETASTVAGAASSGTPGEIRWDSGYLYVCVASGDWRRIPLSWLTGALVTDATLPVFVQDAAPTNPPARYLWVQTNMPPDGEGITFWIEDGD